MGIAAREVGVGVRHKGTGKAEAGYSPFMEAVYESLQAAEPMRSFCPFGCADEDVDEYGRCHHVIGYSPDGKHVEPLVRDPDGRLKVMVDKFAVKNGRRVPVLDRVDRRKHHLVQITTSYVVYEDRPLPPDWLPAEPDDGTEDTDDETED